jgi:hypothetical protein
MFSWVLRVFLLLVLTCQSKVKLSWALTGGETAVSLLLFFFSFFFFGTAALFECCVGSRYPQVTTLWHANWYLICLMLVFSSGGLLNVFSLPIQSQETAYHTSFIFHIIQEIRCSASTVQNCENIKVLKWSICDLKLFSPVIAFPVQVGGGL